MIHRKCLTKTLDRKTLDTVSRLLTHAVERVCSLLSTVPDGGSGGLSAIEVDLTEGTKQFVVATQRLVTGLSKKRAQDSKTEVDWKATVAESEIGGSQLSTICQSSAGRNSSVERLEQMLREL